MSEEEPDEFQVTNADGSVTKMINTASGPIPLDFSNTKIIRDGKVVDINELDTYEIQLTAGAQLEKAESQEF